VVIRGLEQLVEESEEKILKKIKETKKKNEEVIKMVKEIKKAGVRILRNDEWQIEEGLVYILKDEKLRLEIIWLHYDMPIVEYEEQ